MYPDSLELFLTQSHGAAALIRDACNINANMLPFIRNADLTERQVWRTNPGVITPAHYIQTSIVPDWEKNCFEAGYC